MNGNGGTMDLCLEATPSTISVSLGGQEVYVASCARLSAGVPICPARPVPLGVARSDQVLQSGIGSTTGS